MPRFAGVLGLFITRLRTASSVKFRNVLADTKCTGSFSTNWLTRSQVFDSTNFSLTTWCNCARYCASCLRQCRSRYGHSDSAVSGKSSSSCSSTTVRTTINRCWLRSVLSAISSMIDVSLNQRMMSPPNKVPFVTSIKPLTFVLVASVTSVRNASTSLVPGMSTSSSCGGQSGNGPSNTHSSTTKAFRPRAARCSSTCSCSETGTSMVWPNCWNSMDFGNSKNF